VTINGKHIKTEK